MKLNNKLILVIIILIGILLRFTYMLTANISEMQYDLGLNLQSANVDYDKIFNLDRDIVKENGNIEYLLQIYKTGHLLDSNTNQGYHPPLHHIITAGFMRFLDLFGVNNKIKLEAAEFPAFIYSIIILIVIYKILKEIELGEFPILLVMLLVSINPLLIYISRLINNDGLVTLLTLVSILYLLKWKKEPSMKNTIILALAIGLGASTKTSIIVMFLPLIIVYLKRMYISVENTKLLKSILIYGLIFSIIALPLTFWYPIRNAIKFNQPPFGILAASDDFKVQNMDFISRWLINDEILDCKLYFNSSNVWNYMITSTIVFSVEDQFLSNNFTMFMKTLSAVLIIFSIYSIVKHIRIKVNENNWNVLIFTYIAWLIGYIFFNISLPYSCTMHSRYIVIPMIISIMYIGRLFQNTNRGWQKKAITIISILYSVSTIIIFASVFIKI